MQRVIQQITGDPRRMFLVDGMGALLSTAFLALLGRFPELFGMPPRICYGLSFMAAMYAAYSLSCYFFARNRWATLLRLIMAANVVHCVITVILIIYYSNSIRLAGFLYFFLEIVVVGIVVYLESTTIHHLPESDRNH